MVVVDGGDVAAGSEDGDEELVLKGLSGEFGWSFRCL